MNAPTWSYIAGVGEDLNELDEGQEVGATMPHLGRPKYVRKK